MQAGWRDKDDLFGFYNAFEKRFAESEFTKALYSALLPANADLPPVIVLDEMNTSPTPSSTSGRCCPSWRGTEWEVYRPPDQSGA